MTTELGVLPRRTARGSVHARWPRSVVSSGSPELETMVRRLSKAASSSAKEVSSPSSLLRPRGDSRTVQGVPFRLRSDRQWTRRGVVGNCGEVVA